MTTTAHSTTPTLAEIAAAQSTTTIFAYDRAQPARNLTSLQALYARRLAQLEVLGGLFDEGVPELTLRGETQQLSLRGDLVANVYAALRENLDNALSQLETEIVQAHLIVAQWAADVDSDYASRTDFVPHILALCEPAAPQAVRLASEQSNAHAQAA